MAKSNCQLPPVELPIEPAKVQKRIDPVQRKKGEISGLLKLSLVHYSDTEFTALSRRAH